MVRPIVSGQAVASVLAHSVCLGSLHCQAGNWQLGAKLPEGLAETEAA